jgi:hypothetical protein
MANRTSKGNVTAKAREEHGDKDEKYPIFDHKSCNSAVQLRHNGKGVSAESVLGRAAAWARKHSDKG